MKHLIWIRYILMAFCIIVVAMGWVVRENVDLLLYWTYLLIGLGIAATVVCSIITLGQNPKSAIRSLVGLVALLVIVGVAWMMSSDVAVVTPTAEYTDAFALKVTDTGLFVTYGCMILAVASIFAGEVRNLFK